MKSKRIFITLVMALALMLALAISSYAATITLYSGADNTSESTTHNGALTLTGNTEANETVTVYFTDDGRAWKAGETVSFTKDTNLYTIECTKISSTAEYTASAGGGNYILTADLDFQKNGSSGSISGNDCTTRLFMNGKSIRTANHALFAGNSHSLYLLGEGSFYSVYGRNIFSGHCKNSNTDVTWLIGKDILLETNKDANNLFTIWNHIGSKSLNVHIYGKIIKNRTGNIGVWSLLQADQNKIDYNIYFHEGSSVEVLGQLIRYNSTGSTAGLGNLYFDGCTVTLPGTDYFHYDKAASTANTYDGTITVTGGTFTAANADTISTFKSAIVSDKKAQDIDETSFKVVCKECEYEKTLAEFVDFATDFSVNLYCPNCGSSQDATTVEKIFTAKGYSISPDGKAISAGYTVNHNSLAIYEEIMGATSYGIVIANADAFEGKTFFDENNKVNTEKSVQVDIDRQYSVFDCALYFDTTSNSTLKLVICAYVIGSDGSVGFVQHTTGESVAQGAIAGGSFKFVTLDIVVALQPATTKEY